MIAKERPTPRRRAGRPVVAHERTTEEAVDWRQWWQAFGRQNREIREFLGFSQQHLARLAGVSQGAVSRLEAGKGLGTPMLVILKISLVVKRALHGVDPAMLKDDLRQFLELERRLSPPVGGLGFNALPITDQPEIDDLVRLYRQVPERSRRAFLSVVRAVASALASEPPPDVEKG